MKKEQLNELLYQALETELGGVQVYTTALRCVVNDELREEWEEYLEQTKNHVQIVQDTMEQLGLDTEAETPGRLVVRHTGESLVKAMEMALESGEKNAAQLVAALGSAHAFHHAGVLQFEEDEFQKFFWKIFFVSDLAASTLRVRARRGRGLGRRLDLA